MPTLEHKIPPPLVAAAIAFAMWPLSSLLPAVAAPDNARLATATVFALAGIAFAAAGAIAFRRASSRRAQLAKRIAPNDADCNTASCVSSNSKSPHQS